MRTHVIFLILGMFSFNLAAQVPYTRQFNPIDLGTIQNALNEKQSSYDQNKAYLDNLSNWILDLKRQTSEKEFHSAMDCYYKRLRSFDGKDLSVMGNEIRKIEIGIKEEIDKYNTRINMANDPNSYWESGKKHFEKSEYALAIHDFSQVISLAPDYSGGYLARGYSYYYLEYYESALEDLTRFLQLEPNNSEVYSYLGWSKYSMGDYLGALSDFNKQVDKEPLNAMAYYNRGSAKSELNDHNGAIIDYTKAVEIDPNFSMAYNNIAWSKFKLKKYSEALVDANKAIEIDKENFIAYDTRSEIKFNMQDYKGCITDADSALGINPQIANCFFLKGRAYYHLGEKQMACELWSKAGELGQAEAYKYISDYCND